MKILNSKSLTLVILVVVLVLQSVILLRMSEQKAEMHRMNTELNELYQEKDILLRQIQDLANQAEKQRELNSLVEQKLSEKEEAERAVALGSGVYEITAYTASADECGSSDGITASGSYATAGRTCASNKFPMGTRLYIEGIGERIVEDTGGMAENVIDVFVDTKAEAFSIGRRSLNVTVLA